MRNSKLIFIFLAFVLLNACGGGSGGSSIAPEFVSKWNFPTNNYSFTLPLVNNGSTNYDFEVDWGDGSPVQSVTSFDDADKTHVYALSGEYEITITGLCEGFRNTGAHQDELIEVVSLGDLGWKNFFRAFSGNTNLLSVKGGKTNEVFTMREMFEGSPLVEPDTSTWDTSSVENMDSMFAGALLANPDTSDWDVSSVTTMNEMFAGADMANPDVSNWDVSNVLSMGSMFAGADIANPDVSDWDVSNVTTIGAMFESTSVANPDVSSWDVSSVTYMSAVFEAALAANPDVTNWNISIVENMSYMFNEAVSFDRDLSGWMTDSVTSCFEFADDTSPSWTLAEKPTFNNCTPGY